LSGSSYITPSDAKYFLFLCQRKRLTVQLFAG
jgi:hypothetical protein